MRNFIAFLFFNKVRASVGIMIDFSHIKNMSAISFKAADSATSKQPAAVSNPIAAPQSPVASYSAENVKAYVPQISTTIKTPEEQQKYTAILKNSDSQTRSKLNALLKNGVLLDKNSNDKSTVLDNLYKIASEPRIKGLNSKTIIKETVDAVANPCVITQNFGDVPKNVEQDILSSPVGTGLTPDSLNVHSACCVATSIEYNIASKEPAEFARMVAGLSSENYGITKNLKMSDISPNTVDAMWLLNEFNIKHKQKDWDNVEVTLEPDRNAVIRARIQNSYKDPLERSCVDVLMQSTLMNIGSQNTYDSLTDTRTGKFNPDNRGLTDIEKNLTEEIAQGVPKVSVTYQDLDEEGKLIGYECDAKTVQKQILDALKMNTNVIIGYTQFDADKKVVNGHEITIIGAEQDKDGKLTFICNDTDDNLPEPIKMSADELIPMIHHAGLPKDVLKDDVQFVDSWKEVLQAYQDSKKAPEQAVAQPASAVQNAPQNLPQTPEAPAV